jgi:hypothetical protein
MRRPRNSDTPQNSLLGDLESIRALLESGRDVRPRGNATDAPAEVPMLDDVVDGALSIDESPLSSRGSFSADAQGPSALADDAIEALMGDEWRASAAGIVAAARRSITAASAHFSREDTSALSQALRQRIDGVLEDWMAEITLANLDILRRRLLDAIEEEVLRITASIGDHDRDRS